jgi:hypothetical protein
LELNTTPTFATRSEKVSFKKKCEKLEVINNRIFVKRMNMTSLEYLEDFDENNKLEKINEVHINSPCCLNVIYAELKQRY